MKKVNGLISAVMALCFVLVFTSGAYATVTINAGAADVTVPQERTAKLTDGAPPYDGTIALGAPGAANITWTTGANYATGNRLKASLDKGAKLIGTWNIFTGGGTTYAFQNLGAGGAATALFQINSDSIGNGVALKFGANAATTARVNVAALAGVTGPTRVTFTGVTLTSGLGTVDQPGDDILINTLTQYAVSYKGAVPVSTVDAINQSAKQFVGPTLNATFKPILVESQGFAARAGICPTFAAGDQLIVTLTDSSQAFSALTNVVFTGGGAKFTRALGSATSQTFNFSHTVLKALAGTADLGNQGIDITMGGMFVANGATEIAPRTVSCSNLTLVLAATGNGTQDLGNFGDIVTFGQNGTLFRGNYARYDNNTTQNMFYKFSNSSTTPMKVEIRYHGKDDTTAGNWTTYDQNIPGYGVLAISKADMDRVLGLGAGNYNGWIEFRIHGNEANISAVCNAKFGDTWFNIPVALQTTTAASATWEQ